MSAVTRYYVTRKRPEDACPYMIGFGLSLAEARAVLGITHGRKLNVHERGGVTEYRITAYEDQIPHGETIDIRED